MITVTRNEVDTGELECFATVKGINGPFDFYEELLPMVESYSATYAIGDFESNAYGMSEGVCRVCIAFMKEHNITEMTIIRG